MTGVELIAAALAAATTAGITSGVQDAYAGLKALLVKRLAGRTAALEALEAGEAEPGVWQTRLGEDLAACGAASDAQILDAARAVLARSGPTGTYTTYTVENNHGGAVGQFNGPVTFVHAPPAPPATPGTV
ncbi:hypothetical protein [Micromonospora halophytica]|uniref:RHIM domain-containing protein n=1 Tax=Micromonospora halophytica TaxID=47864 RepID=A0A1C5I863_9ACTN|nr:hypothetical protein [Micromonospora halophytica]SCG54510.1 hypothetical protein GA0070560_1093 [Micromonospora halophytica]